MLTWFVSILLSLSIFGGTPAPTGNSSDVKDPTSTNTNTGREKGDVIVGDFIIK